jgi:pilus assembly protein CpaF
VPFVDARLPDEGRAHAVLGCLGSPGTCISLRVPAQRTLSLQDCVASGSLTPGAAQLLTPMIEARLAFLISGGTGSGKPTLASYLGREGISRSSPGRGSKLVQAQSLCAPS